MKHLLLGNESVTCFLEGEDDIKTGRLSTDEEGRISFVDEEGSSHKISPDDINTIKVEDCWYEVLDFFVVDDELELILDEIYP